MVEHQLVKQNTIYFFKHTVCPLHCQVFSVANVHKIEHRINFVRI